MSKPIRILLQTTVPSTNDDWGIDRLSMLRDYLASLQDDAGNPACEVVARDRQLNDNGMVKPGELSLSQPFTTLPTTTGVSRMGVRAS
jgi:hypothetical protein